MFGFTNCEGDGADGISFFFDGWSVPDEYIRGTTVLTVQRVWTDEACKEAAKNGTISHQQETEKEDDDGKVKIDINLNNWLTHSKEKSRRDTTSPSDDCSRVAHGNLELPHGDFWQVPGWGQQTHPEEMWMDWQLI